MKEHKYQNLVITSDLFLQIIIGLVIVQIFLLQFPEMRQKKVFYTFEKLLFPFLLPFKFLCQFISSREEVPLLLLLGVLIAIEKILPRILLSS